MAEANSIYKQESLEQGEPMTGYQVSGFNDDDSFNAFISRLHESLDLYQLFNTFVNELRVTVPCDSISYKNIITETSMINGSIARHCCDYAMNYEGLLLGTISISRNSRFVDDEINRVENLLAAMTLPLHNALRYQQAIRVAQRDTLTGLRNGSYYHDVVGLEIKRSHRYQCPFSLLMLDIDDFDDINSRYGRSAGDALLNVVAKRISDKARDSDVVYRSGGDKFLVFLPNTEQEEAGIVAKRMKEYVLAKACQYQNKLISFTLSIGVVTVSDDDTADKLIERADKAIFHAKILGKDRIYVDSIVDEISAGQI